MLRGLVEMALVAEHMQVAAGDDVQAGVLDLENPIAEAPAPPTTHLRPIVGAHG